MYPIGKGISKESSYRVERALYVLLRQAESRACNQERNVDGDTKHDDLCAWALSVSIKEGWQEVGSDSQVRISRFE